MSVEKRRKAGQPEGNNSEPITIDRAGDGGGVEQRVTNGGRESQLDLG